MFRAAKKPFEVEVSLNGKEVKVKALHNNVSDSLLYRTLARCEEFLAQVFLQEQQVKDAYPVLVRFFKGRGWNVSEIVA
jgi:hypothetical protein